MDIKEISLVSSLKWNSINEDCLICNNPIGCNCIKCDQRNSINDIKCLSITNDSTVCKHSFHIHCLAQYHKTNQLKCPMCINKWVNNIFKT